MSVVRRSARLNTSSTSDCSLNLSNDLWCDESSDNGLATQPEQNHDKWLSKQLPPSPPSAWNKNDLRPRNFVDALEVKTRSSQNVTPFGIFNRFFDDEVINYIVDMTNLYGRREKGIVGFSTDNCEIRTFLAIMLLTGYNGRPRTRMHWEKKPTRYCQGVANSMTRKRFEDIMRCFHVSDNMQLAANDKMAKVRPFFNIINKRCLDNRTNRANLSVDEAMLPYFGKNNSKQRINNKPIRVGYKMWVLAEDSGYVV